MRWWWAFTALQLRNLLVKRHWLVLSVSYQALMVALFPLALGGGHPALPVIAPVLLWLGLMLSMLLNLHLLFDDDWQDGLLEQWALHAPSLEWLVLAKSLYYWLAAGVPLLLLVPLLGIWLGVEWGLLASVWLALLPGSIALSALATLVAALTAGMSHRGGLAYVLLLPLMIPLLLFGLQASSGMPGSAASLLALCGLALALTPIAVILAAQSLKHAIVNG